MNSNPWTENPVIWQSRFNLQDGGQVSIRPFQPADRAEVTALLERLSPQTRYHRFHSAAVRINAEMLDLVTAGHALVAEVEGRIVGLASYHLAQDSSEAEIGILVEDAHQRRGIGTKLSACLAGHAQHAGVRRLRAETLSVNAGMIRLLRGLNYPLTYTSAQSVIEFDIELQPAAA
jgi:RimJ/RimL family protein N-acetyltransferase